MLGTIGLLGLLTAAQSEYAWRADKWMGDVLNVIPNATLLDLSLPGTHDSLTYDLSNSVSDNANDIPKWLSTILHVLPPNTISQTIRKWATTQTINITRQLDNGIRFIDFRIVYSAPPHVGDGDKGSVDGTSNMTWYGLHMLQTNRPAVEYLLQIADWMRAHPTEAIVLYVSRHGSRCPQREFESISSDIPPTFLVLLQRVLGDLIWDTRRYDIAKTPIREAIAKGGRVVVMLASYNEIVYNTTQPWLALNTCRHLNETHGHPLLHKLGDVPSSLVDMHSTFAAMPDNRVNAAFDNRFYLTTTTIQPEPFMVQGSVAVDLAPIGKDTLRARCAGAYRIPNMTRFCPDNLLVVNMLGAYYGQRVYEKVYSDLRTWAGARSKGSRAAAPVDFPHAIYTDVLEEGGILLTGADDVAAKAVRPVGALGGTGGGAMRLVGYPYCVTMVAANLLRNCANTLEGPCAVLLSLYERARSEHPIELWSDEYGHNDRWPVFE